MGFGTSAQQTTNKNAQNQSIGNLGNIFNYAMPAGESTTGAGLSSLGSAQGYWQSLLSGGRTQTALNAAPATNAALAQSDAARKQEANLGTGRGGGTASANREASTTTSSTIDNIINQNLMGGKQAAAQGLASSGVAEAGVGGNLLGLGEQSQATTAWISETGLTNEQKIAQGYTAQLSNIVAAYFS